MPPEAAVSVVIPCRDAAPFLAEAIESVLGQSGVPVEVIVVDDGSRDGSRAIAGSYGGRVRVVSQEGCGACSARNRGAGLASGRYLMFLDADDVLAPGTLAALAAALADARLGMAACAWSWLVRAGGRWRVVPGLPTSPPGGDAVAGWLEGWYIPPCAVLWTREAFERTGGWDETLVADQDGDLVLRALLDGMEITLAAGGHAYYRDHGRARMSVSKNASPEALRSRLRVVERAAERLGRDGRAARYAVALGRAYHRLARLGYDTDVGFARTCADRAARMAGASAVAGPLPHRWLCRVLGLERERRFARAVRTTWPVRLARSAWACRCPPFRGVVAAPGDPLP